MLTAQSKLLLENSALRRQNTRLLKEIARSLHVRGNGNSRSRR